MARRSNPLITIAVIVGLSLAVAVVLFGILSSTGIVKSDIGEFGGAAAGFFATLFALMRWHSKVSDKYERSSDLEAENETLKRALERMNVPAFQLPESFVSFIDHEHSMLLGYPKEWQRQPLLMRMQGVFREDPIRLRPKDDVPGSFNIVVSSPGQQTYSLREVLWTAKALDISKEEVAEELGVEINDRTLSLQVPLEQLLSLMGAEGDRSEQIYELNHQFAEAVFGKDNVRRDSEIVSGKRSMLLEVTRPRKGEESLVQFQVITYVPETDLIFTFTFTDNESDRESIDLIRKEVTSTVKFWKAGSPARDAVATG